LASLVVGALLGALLLGLAGGEDFVLWGGLLGAIVGYRLNALARRAAALDERLQALSAAFARLQATLGAAAAPAAEPPAAEPPAASATPPRSPGSVSAGLEPDPMPPRPRPEAARPPARPPQPSVFEPVVAAVRAYFATGNVVARVGVIVLFFGLAFLLKYAAEQGVVPIELRLAGVAAGGIALIVGGWRLRARAGYGLILQGAGVGALYLTTFTALRLYDLLPPALAFGLMLALVALATSLALLQDSRALAMLGSAGGFLAPVLTSTGQGSHVALFSFYALLNLGIFAIAWRRAWRGLNVLGFAFTFGIGSLWAVASYRSEHYATTQAFLVFFFLLYVAVAILFATRQPPRLRGYVDGTLVFGVPVAGFTLQAGLAHGFGFGVAFSALAVSALYVVMAGMLWRRGGEGLRLLAESFLALGIAFGTLAVPLALEGNWAAATWALEGAALIWVGVRQQRLLPRLAGVLLQVAAGVAFALGAGRTAAMPDVFNSVYIGAVLIALAGLFGAFYLERHGDVLRRFERGVAYVLLGWGVLWWVGAGIAEIDWITSRHLEAANLTFLALTALALERVAARLEWRAAGRVPIALLPCATLVAWAMLAFDQSVSLFVGWTALGWAAVAVVHFALLRLRADDWPGSVVGYWHTGGLWLAVVALMFDVAWVVEWRTRLGSGWDLAAWAGVPVLVLAVLTAVRPTFWPLTTHGSAYRRDGSLPVAAFLYLWLWFASFVEGSPAPLAYVPLVNPVELTQVIVLLVLLQWWLRIGRGALGARMPTAAVPVALGLAGFMMLNGVLARSVAAFTDIGFAADALYRSIWFQSGLSILWSVLALGIMRVSGRRGLPALWFVGGGLLALVVLKLFLVELANTGTVARIVSFVAVGLLMLLIGYLSPMPPRQAPRVES
jgi:uncharacterized membrane protein